LSLLTLFAKFLEDNKILEVKLISVYSDYEKKMGWKEEGNNNV
jgi:hypothetical protein